MLRRFGFFYGIDNISFIVFFTQPFSLGSKEAK
jgi:hypothetical protein